MAIFRLALLIPRWNGHGRSNTEGEMLPCGSALMPSCKCVFSQIPSSLAYIKFLVLIFEVQQKFFAQKKNKKKHRKEERPVIWIEDFRNGCALRKRNFPGSTIPLENIHFFGSMNLIIIQ